MRRFMRWPGRGRWRMGWWYSGELLYVAMVRGGGLELVARIIAFMISFRIQYILC